MLMMYSRQLSQLIASCGASSPVRILVLIVLIWLASFISIDALGQDKWFVTSNRGGPEGAKAHAQLTTLMQATGSHQVSITAAEACGNTGRIYGPAHAVTDAHGCLAEFVVGSSGEGVGLGRTPSEIWRLSVADGATPGHTATFGSNAADATYIAITHDAGGDWYLASKPDGTFAIHSPSDADKLVVTRSGALKIFGSTEICNSSREGTLRYNPAIKRIEFCNGTAWSDLGNDSSGPQPCSYTLTKCTGTTHGHCTPSCPNGWMLESSIHISTYAYWTGVGLCKRC